MRLGCGGGGRLREGRKWGLEQAGLTQLRCQRQAPGSGGLVLTVRSLLWPGPSASASREGGHCPP